MCLLTRMSPTHCICHEQTGCFLAASQFVQDNRTTRSLRLRRGFPCGMRTAAGAEHPVPRYSHPGCNAHARARRSLFRALVDGGPEHRSSLSGRRSRYRTGARRPGVRADWCRRRRSWNNPGIDSSRSREADARQRLNGGTPIRAARNSIRGNCTARFPTGGAVHS